MLGELQQRLAQLSEVLQDREQVRSRHVLTDCMAGPRINSQLCRDSYTA